MSDSESDLDLTQEKQPEKPAKRVAFETEPYDPLAAREGTRGDLARGLLYLLTFAIGGVLVFIGVGRLDGTVLTQSVFPSLIALAGTALGFYFGSQTTNDGAAAGGKPSTSATGASSGRSGSAGSSR